MALFGSIAEHLRQGKETIIGRAVIDDSGTVRVETPYAIIDAAVVASAGVGAPVVTSDVDGKYVDFYGWRPDVGVNASGAAGEWTEPEADGDDQVYQLIIGGITVASFVRDDDGVVTAVELQGAIDAATPALIAAGFTVTGDVAGEDLVVTRVDGVAFDIEVINTMAEVAGGFDGADWGTGVNNVDDADVENTDLVPSIAPTEVAYFIIGRRR